jgi:hypothetical protein
MRCARMLPLMTGRAAVAIVLMLCTVAPAARAQDPPPRIPLLVVDLHGTFTNFPNGVGVPESRGLTTGELPGAALGADLALHLYPLHWRAITFGIGGQVIYARAHNTPPIVEGQTPLQPVTERFVSGGPQLSFNFGSGTGWSYISGGIGRSVWQIVPDGADPQAADQARLNTSNYGGGARWFIRKHLAFSFDVRFYAISPGPPGPAAPGSPRTRMLIIGAGASVK